MKGKRLSVSAIQQGTVIDHISSGQALPIVRLLYLHKHAQKVSIGLNLPSKRFQTKDLVKVEGWEISPEEANKIAILAPEATISIIKNFKVCRKFQVVIPEELENVIPCPNPRCVTNHQPVATRFQIQQGSQGCQLMCSYCRNWFSLEHVTDDKGR